MKRNKKLTTFLAGMATSALLLGCVAGAFAAGGGSVHFGLIRLSIDGATALEKDSALTNANGSVIPSSIVYTDEYGGGSTYLPIAAISDLLELPIQWDGSTGTVNLGRQSGQPDVTIRDDDRPADVSQLPLTRVGARSGHILEVEPKLPPEGEYSYWLKDAKFESNLSFEREVWFSPQDDYISLTVTNRSDFPVYFNAGSGSPWAKDYSIPSTVIPAGATVTRTFVPDDQTTYVAKSLWFTVEAGDLADSDEIMQLTISAINYGEAYWTPTE